MIPSLLASVLVGAGLGLIVRGVATRRRRLAKELIASLMEPSASAPAEAASPPNARRAVNAAIRLAGGAVERFDPKGSLGTALARARIPLRPGEYVLTTLAASFVVAELVLLLTSSRPFVVIAVGGCVAGSALYLRRRISKLRRRFESQLPEALTLIASSLSAGHTLLRSLQMMCQEADPPIADEFARVVAETRLGDPLVDALARMAERLQIRDLDWVVQAIRIQQTVGGRLAELLHTLAEFIRAREEVRREVKVLTAEGRMSAWVLAGLAPFLLLAVQVVNPEYLAPMLRGWGLLVLGASGGSVLMGVLWIFRMAKVEV